MSGKTIHVPAIAKEWAMLYRQKNSREKKPVNDVNIMEKNIQDLINRCMAIIQPYAADDSWITVKPNGQENTGRPVLLGEGGEIKAGMGGKFNGKTLSEIPRIGKGESTAVQGSGRFGNNAPEKEEKTKQAPNRSAPVKSNEKNSPPQTPTQIKNGTKEFTTTSNRIDGVEINTYQLSFGIWQSDVLVGLGSRKEFVDRNQHKTEASARKWAQKEMKSLEDKYKKS